MMTTSDLQGAVNDERLLPLLEELRSVPWSADIAKQRGIYGFDSRDIRSRPFNLIRSQILELYRRRGWRLFGVISATPGVGKSFIATNMAAALSRVPALHTYLVDLDLRRGSVARNFGFNSERGMRQYLEGEFFNLKDAAFRPGDERLIVVPSDRSRVHSAELLANERAARFIAEMTNLPKEHLFVCDLPPVFANDDASIVVSKLDAYIMVVEDGRTTKKQISESVKMLDQSRCAGVILNHFDGGLLRDTFGYGYGSSKGYGEYFN